jgi:Tfp pilus assembly protein PilO
MSKDQQYFTSVIKRELASKPENQALAFAVLFVLNLIIFGYFGVYKGVKSYRQKSSQLSEYTTAIENLEMNKKVLVDFEPYIQNNPGVEAISKAVPVDPTNSEFLREFSSTFVTNGFALERVTVNPVAGADKIKITSEDQGTISEFADLIQDLESMERFISIKGVRVKPVRSQETVNYLFDIEAEMYYVKGNADI